MKIYQRPNFELVEIKYEYIAQHSGSPMASSKTDGSLTGDEPGNGEGPGGQGDEADAAAYRGLWDDDEIAF